MMRPSASFLKTGLRKFQTVKREGIPKRNGKTERVTCGSCHGCVLQYHNVSHLTPHPVPVSPHNPHASLTSYPQCLSPHTPPNASPTSFLNQCFSYLIPHQTPLSPHTPPNALITSYPTICLSPLIDLYLNPVCSYLKCIYKFH